MRKVYEAFDGTLFPTEGMCRNYETEMAVKFMGQFEAVPKYSTKYMETPFDIFCGDDVIHAIYIDSEETRKAVNDLLSVLHKNSISRIAHDIKDGILGEDCIGTVQLISINKELYTMLGTPNEFKEYLCKAVDGLVSK